MELISKITKSTFSILFGKRENYVVRASRNEPNLFRVLDENGSILFQGTQAGCNLFKETMDRQMK